MYGVRVLFLLLGVSLFDVSQSASTELSNPILRQIKEELEEPSKLKVKREEDKEKKHDDGGVKDSKKKGKKKKKRKDRKRKKRKKNDDDEDEEEASATYAILQTEMALSSTEPSFLPSLAPAKKSVEEMTQDDDDYYDTATPSLSTTTPSPAPLVVDATGMPTIQEDVSRVLDSPSPTFEASSGPSFSATTLPTTGASVETTMLPTLQTDTAETSAVPTQADSVAMVSAMTSASPTMGGSSNMPFSSVPNDSSSSSEAPTAVSGRVLAQVTLTTLSVEDRMSMERAIAVAKQRGRERTSMQEYAKDANVDTYISAQDVLRDTRNGKQLLTAVVATLEEIIEEDIMNQAVAVVDTLEGNDRRLAPNEAVVLMYSPDDLVVADDRYWLKLSLAFEVYAQDSREQMSAKEVANIQSEMDQAIQRRVESGSLTQMLQVKEERIMGVTALQQAPHAAIAPDTNHATASTKRTVMPLRATGIVLLSMTLAVGLLLPYLAKRARQGPEQNGKTVVTRRTDLSSHDAVNAMLRRGSAAASITNTIQALDVIVETTSNVSPYLAPVAEENASNKDMMEDSDDIYRASGHEVPLHDEYEEGSFINDGSNCGSSRSSSFEDEDMMEFKRAYSQEYDDIPASLIGINLVDGTNPGVLDYKVKTSPAASTKKFYKAGWAE